MNILCDLDGVLVSFVDGVFEHYGDKPHYEKDKQYSWDLFGERGYDAGDFWNSIGTNFWRNLKKTPFADELVDILLEFFEPSDITILTAPPDTGYEFACRGKRDWIRDNYPQFERQILLGSHKEACAGPLSLLIDDSDSNLEKFAKKKGNYFRVNSPWNSGYNREPLQGFRGALTEFKSLCQYIERLV